MAVKTIKASDILSSVDYNYRQYLAGNIKDKQVLKKYL